MEDLKTKEVLIYGLKQILTNQDVILAIVLMLKSEDQKKTMIDWIWKHKQESPSEDFVIAIAKKIVGRVD